MMPYGLLLVALLSTFLGIGWAQANPIQIVCGSNSSIGVGGRKWVGDLTSDGNFTLSSPGIIASTDTVIDVSVHSELYKTARIFNTTTNYNFSIMSGHYFIRLHFHSFYVDFYNTSEPAFEIMANNLKLVSKFNVKGELSLKSTMSNSNVTSLVKEYFLNVTSNELLIEFSPNSGSFAFVNAIEVIPIPPTIFFGSMNKVGGNGLRSPLIDRGMETMYRLNMGVTEVESIEDSDMWRRWASDENFMFSLNAANKIANTTNISYASSSDSSIAPLVVYETARIMTNNEVMEKRFNMSWKFEVDPNFDYLIRMHFCELFYASENQRIFRIYINNKTAAENYDVYARAGGNNKAYHEDYLDTMPSSIGTLWIQLGPEPSTSASNTDALLNGLEIFKLSRNGNLAHESEKIDAGGIGLPPKKKKSTILWAAIGVGSVAIMIIVSVAFSVFICFCIRKNKKTPLQRENPPGWRPLVLHGAIGSTTNAMAPMPPLVANGLMATGRMGRMFTLAELKATTKNFDESLVIGIGGFGKVYKGEIENGTLVAIKRANTQSEQGLTEFETEIEMLSKLRHRHLVSMIGYCDEQNEMILVYEYMANGTLRSHLFGSDLPPLTWKQRLDACIGAARGLHHLHTGAEGGIIHRDVKTTNILLDENFDAKMADFGISKTGPALDHTHVSTAVKGSFGYLDPEYFRRQQLTQKSDVYSFGVVLFEVVCARPVINPSLPKDEINLAEWAIKWQQQQSLETIVDPRLDGNYSLESLKKFGEIAEKCLADEGRNRPTMGEVLWHLEYVLKLHETYAQGGDVESFAMSELTFSNMSLRLPDIMEGEEGSSRINENSVDPKSDA